VALRWTGHSADDGVKSLLSDHLCSTGVLVNQDGPVASRQYYHPDGDNRNGSFSTLTTKRFTGQYHEARWGAKRRNKMQRMRQRDIFDPHSMPDA